MSTTLKSLVTAQIGWAWRDQSGDFSVLDASRLEFKRELENGDADGQCDAVWHCEGRSLAAGESEILYLDDLARTVFNNAISIAMAKVKALCIVNRSPATGGYLLAGGAVTNAWHAPFGAMGDVVKVMQNSPVLLANTESGWDVAADACALQLQAVGGDATYDIALIGVLESADDGSTSLSS